MAAPDRRRTVAMLLMVLLVWPMLNFGTAVLAPDPDTSEAPDRCPPSSQRCARLAHDGSSHRLDDAAPVIDMSPCAVHTKVLEWAESERRVSVLHSSGGSEGPCDHVHLKQRTLVWGFPDDVHVLLEGDDSSTQVTVQSESRLGGSDLGVNPARIQGLVSFLTT